MKKFFTMRMAKHLNKLPGDLVDALSLVTFKVKLDWFEQPDLVEDVPAHCRGDWTRGPSGSLPTQTIL